MTLRTSLALVMAVTLSSAAGCSSGNDGAPTSATDADGGATCELCPDASLGTTSPDAPTPDGSAPRDAGKGETDAAAAPDAAPAVQDVCAAPHGVSADGKTRYMHGVNLAWKNFGADFGGIPQWGQKSVSQDPEGFAAWMKTMKASGTNVVRWWVFPEIKGDGVAFDASGVPTGITATLRADIQKALELANANDLRILFTLYSFDGFRPTRTESAVVTHGLHDLVVDGAKRDALMTNVVSQVAFEVKKSPNRDRVVAWDLMNEPEWAVTGSDAYGDPSFDPMPDLQSVTHPQMETFLKALSAAVHGQSSAAVSVGSAGIKWAKAWSQVPQDFYQLHYYGWLYEYFNYKTVTPASVGLTGKPVVMGEFPWAGLPAVPSRGYPAVSASQFMGDLWTSGYAGGLGWDYSDWTPDAVKTFAAAHPCETHY